MLKPARERQESPEERARMRHKLARLKALLATGEIAHLSQDELAAACEGSAPSS